MHIYMQILTNIHVLSGNATLVILDSASIASIWSRPWCKYEWHLHKFAAHLMPRGILPWKKRTKIFGSLKSLQNVQGFRDFSQNFLGFWDFLGDFFFIFEFLFLKKSWLDFQIWRLDQRFCFSAWLESENYTVCKLDSRKWTIARLVLECLGRPETPFSW